MAKAKKNKKPTLERMLKKAPPKKKKEEIKCHHLIALMAEKKISQAEMVERTGISFPHFNKILHGHRKCISLPIAMKICRVLKTPVEKVFEIY